MRLNVLSDRKGFALEATLFVLLLLAVLCAFAVTGVTTATRTANYDYRNSRTAYAAEGAADDIMQQLSGMVDDGFISQTELDSLTRPSVPGFTIANMSVRAVGGATQETVNDGPFAGLFALVRNYDITARAVDSIGNASQAVVSVKSAAIPIFQFGVFYEKDLEVNNGQRLDMQGWVHSNGNIYSGSTVGTYYHNIITTPNRFFHRRKDGNASGFQVYIDNASGSAMQVNQANPENLTAAAFRSWSEGRFSGRLKTNAYGVDSLRLPLPDGVPPEELIRPQEGSDTPDERDAKFAWKADWYMTINYPTFRTGPANLCTSGAIAIVRTGGRTSPTAAECALIFQADTSKWWESREQTFVDQLEIDYQQLFNWMGANAARRSSIMYITFVNVPDSAVANFRYNAGVRGCTVQCFFKPYPVIRIKNARRLGSPFTLATNHPFYIWGDYNSDPVNWQPSAIVGDAFTWLATNWDDAPRVNRGPNQQNIGGRIRWTHAVQNAATIDSIYAAILAGHSRTPFDYVTPGALPAGCNPTYTGGSASYYYGGGLENFPRFLQGWPVPPTSQAVYRGSLVSIAYSQQATNDCAWAGAYYGAPRRDWAFDTRFQDPANLPPGTPVVGSVVQTAFRPVYE